MSEFNKQKLLELIMDIAPGRGTAEHESDDEDKFLKNFLPIADYRLALEPNTLLILGGRGVGKTELFRLLAIPSGRESLVESLKIRSLPDLSKTTWIAGFGRTRKTEKRFPTPESVETKMDRATNIEWRSFWIGLILGGLLQQENFKFKDLLIEQIEQIGRQGDSIGGVVECVARNVPKGLGSPVFDKLEADIAKGVMSLPATKGFEIGSGFAGTLLTGSEHNDEFYTDEMGEIRTVTNRSGGIQGGISNGENIILRVAFKPTATIRKEQRTVNREGAETLLAAKGRHDPCVLPRAVPMVEAMVALVLCDHLLRHQGQCGVL